jgi:hypothetical protein
MMARMANSEQISGAMSAFARYTCRGIAVSESWQLPT